MAKTKTVKKSKGKTKIIENEKGEKSEPFEQEEVVDEKLVDTPQANVGISLSYTKNLGDFNSVKVEVSLHMPCEPTKKDVNKTAKRVEDWVNDKMEELVGKL